MIIGVGAALGWPWIIGKKPPKTAPISVQLDFLTKGVAVVGVSLLSFILAGIGAILIVRVARADYQAARTEMLKDLIEGTQEDIRKQQDAKA